MKLFSLMLAGMLLALGAQAAAPSGTWRMPARQVSVNSNDWGVLAPTNDNTQATFDWIDDNMVTLDLLNATSNALADAIVAGDSNTWLAVTNLLGTNYWTLPEQAVYSNYVDGLMLTGGVWEAGDAWGAVSSNQTMWLTYNSNVLSSTTTTIYSSATITNLDIGPYPFAYGDSWPKTYNFYYTQTTAQIQAIINSAPRWIPQGSQMNMYFNDGTYASLEDKIYFSGFFGGGTLVILGNPAEGNFSASDVNQHTNQAVHLNFTAIPGVERGLVVENIAGPIVMVLNLKVTANTDDFSGAGGCLDMRNVHQFYTKGNYFVAGAATNFFGGAFLAVHSQGSLEFNKFSGGTYSIGAIRASLINSSVNTNTATASYGFYSLDGSTIGKSGWTVNGIELYPDTAQPQGDVAASFTDYGGTVQ